MEAPRPFLHYSMKILVTLQIEVLSLHRKYRRGRVPALVIQAWPGRTYRTKHTVLYYHAKFGDNKQSQCKNIKFRSSLSLSIGLVPFLQRIEKA